MPNVKFIVIIEVSFIVESPLQPIGLHGPNLTRTPFSKSRQMIYAQKISIICTHASQFTGSFTWQSENFHNLIQVKRNIKLVPGEAHCSRTIVQRESHDLPVEFSTKNWIGPPNHPSMSPNGIETGCLIVRQQMVINLILAAVEKFWDGLLSMFWTLHHPGRRV